MAKKINLKVYTKPAKRLNYNAGDILRKVRLTNELNRIKQSFGLVTYGVVEATQVEGGYGWAISDYISFPYIYINRPNFTHGMDGTAQLDYASGTNSYSETLPDELLAYYSEEEGWDATEYQPAIFVPRVIHWHKVNQMYYGCYLLVCQLNPESTETDKTIRIHYRFEGEGFVKG
jgi:hypothetical protein